MEQLTLKQERRFKAKQRLEVQLKSGVKLEDGKKVPLTPQDIDRIKKEIIILSDRLAGKKKEVVNSKGEVIKEVPKEKWFLDIYHVTLNYVKQSERRKNKGKSKKKLKKMKSMSFVKTLILQPGMLTSYREGKMGISPKTHVFKTRKEELDNAWK